MRKLVKALCLIFVLCISLCVFACDVGLDHPKPTADEYFEVELVGTSYAISAKEGVELPSEIILPSEIDGKKITKIADYGFANTDITKMAIPEGYTEIGAYAFQNCFKLTTVEIADTVKKLLQGAFSGCTAYKNTLYIPDSVEYIGNECFELCTSLSVVSIPKNCIQGIDLAKGVEEALRIEARNK